MARSVPTRLVGIIYPRVKTSIDYCIRTFGPRHPWGRWKNPIINTYDIEFWGRMACVPVCTFAGRGWGGGGCGGAGGGH